MKPKQIEEFLALFAGILLGVLIFSVASYYLLKLLYKGVDTNMDFMRMSIPPIISAKQMACASYVTPIVLTGPAGTGLAAPVPDLGSAKLGCAVEAISSVGL